MTMQRRPTYESLVAIQVEDDRQNEIDIAEGNSERSWPDLATMICREILRFTDRLADDGILTWDEAEALVQRLKPVEVENARRSVARAVAEALAE